MKKIIALLVVLELAAFCAPAESGDGFVDYTYVNNLSSRTIVVSTSYLFPYARSSNFIDRVIPPGTYEGDEYSTIDCNLKPGQGTVLVALWVKGACCYNHVEVACDISLVAFDNADKSGVEIYFAAYGNLNHPDGDRQITIYPWWAK